MALIPYERIARDTGLTAEPPLLIDAQPVAELYCGDPRCDCVTGHLWVRGVGMAIDVGTGRLDFLDGMRTPDRERLRGALAMALREGDNLERLRRHYRATQEYGWEHHFEHVDWTGLKQGEFVGYTEIFLKEHVPLFPIIPPPEKSRPPGTEEQHKAEDVEKDEAKEEKPAYYLGLADAYCVEARCDCRRVMWSATANLPDDGNHVRRLGVVAFDFRKGEPQVVQVAPGINPDQLLIMVLGLLHRYPQIIAEHERRYAQMRQVMLPLIARQRREKEQQQRDPLKDVGRNDPCPCGSGKKFKKCHGQAPGNKAGSAPRKASSAG